MFHIAKVCLQVLNTSSPNSKEQTVVVACFESIDTRSNLETGFEKIRESIEKLNNSTWNGKKVVLTLFGDYQFLCNSFGISGACGKYPCLWCHISKENIQIEDNWKDCENRSLETLEHNLEQFKNSGQKLKNAKECFNVINRPILAIYIDMVCPPYLHILLGIVKKHHDLYMIHSTKIDEKVGNFLAKNGSTFGKNKQFLAFIGDYSKYLDLLKKQNETTSAVEKAMSKKCTKKTQVLKSKYSELQDEIDNSKESLVLEVNQGPISSSVDQILQKHRITVQSYHSRSFTGNHCHKYLDQKINPKICDHVHIECKNILSQFNGDAKKVHAILEKAKEVSELFKELNHKFARVHNSISHCLPIAEEEAVEIEQYICDYLRFFREKIGYQIIPKQHFLEAHVMPWIRKWQVGLGLHGEQGCESTHAIFNSLKHSMRSVHHPLQNLKLTMREHHVRTSPGLTSTLPKSMRRRLFD